MSAHPWRHHAYHLLLWLVALVFFFPVFWIFLAAFKSGGQIVSREPVFFFQPTLDNITRVLGDPNFLEYLKMSFILSIGSVLIAIGVSFLAAYSFSRYRPTGTNFIMFLLLSTRMVPAPAVVSSDDLTEHVHDDIRGLIGDDTDTAAGRIDQYGGRGGTTRRPRAATSTVDLLRVAGRGGRADHVRMGCSR